MANSTTDTVLSNLKSMTSWSERIDYIWTYFKVHILIVLGMGGVIVGLLVSMFTPDRAVLKIIALNTDTVASIAETFDPFLEAHGYKTGEKSIVFDKTILVDAKDDAHLEEIMPFLMRLSVAQDLFIGSGMLYEDTIKSNEGLLVDLREILEPEQLEQLELFYTDDNGMADPYPCAVMIRENGVFATDCYVGICFSSEHPQAAIEFLNYLLSL